MGWVDETARRIRMLLHRKQFDADLEEEMKLHLQLRAEERLRSGAPPREAYHAANRLFGNVTGLREQSHMAWGWQRLENFLHDIRYGCRTMLRTPVVTAIAVLSLALGIGANTAIFSLLNAIMLRELPVENPRQLVLFGEGKQVGSTCCIPNEHSDLFSYPLYQEIRHKNQSFTDIAAIMSIQFSTHGFLSGRDPELTRTHLVSGNYFQVLGVEPLLGRLLLETDDAAPGSGPVAVASYSYWKKHFGDDPSILGRTVRIESTTYTIVGVTPREFFGTTVGQSPDFWIPLSMQKEVSPGWNGREDKLFESLYLIGRLKEGVTISSATGNINLLLKEILQDQYLGHPLSAQDTKSLQLAHIELTPADKGLSPLRIHFAAPLKILMTLVGLILIIACTNIASLLLSRGTSRQKEFAVRTAIGAGRMRLLQQLLTESLMLAFAGGFLGLGLAWKAGSILLQLTTSSDAAIPIDVTPDRYVLAFTLLTTVATALVFGIFPALRSTKLELTPSLKDGRRATAMFARNTLGKSLIVLQVALTVTLLTGAMLFLRSLIHLSHTNTGFDSQHVLIFGIDEYGAGLGQDEHLVQLQQQVEERIARIPGVQSVSFAMFTFNQGVWSDDVSVEGVPRSEENSHSVLYNVVGPGFFQTMGLPLLAGRNFTSQDTTKTPAVAVINQTMQRRFFPSGSAVGHHFGLGTDPFASRDIEIIGVVKDAKYASLGESQRMAAYFPYSQRIQYFGNLLVRTSRSSGELSPEVRQAIVQVNPSLLLNGVSTLSERVSDSINNQRLIAQLSVFFGSLAVLLAAIGIYGLTSYAVAQRTNEIGVRMALGATRSNVLWMVLRDILRLLMTGLAIGIPLSFASTYILSRLEVPQLDSSMLFGLNPSDPSSLGLATAVILGVALAAGYLPGHRAAHIDPLIALREE